MQPDTRYAKSGEVHIAYQVFGHGPVNLVVVPGFVSNVETAGSSPIFPVGCSGWRATLGWRSSTNAEPACLTRSKTFLASINAWTTFER